METNFNFKSQLATSIEQSERLLALGLKKETADMFYSTILENDDIARVCYEDFWNSSKVIDGYIRRRCIPAWSLHRLIEMTKLKVTPFLYGVEISHPLWERAFVKRANVWDNLCDCIEWLIKEGYFPKEYLV